MAKFERPTGTYTPTQGTLNLNKYNDDSTAIPPVPISSTKVDADINRLIDAVNDIDQITGGTGEADLEGAVTNLNTRVTTNEADIANLTAGTVPDADYGDITVSSSATQWTIDNEAVTEAKLAVAVQGVLAKIKISDNDTTAGDLEAKLLAGTGLVLSTQNDGGNETRTVAVDGADVATDGQVLTADGLGGVAFEDLPATPDASETVKGIIETATNAEAFAGTATDKAIVPSNFKATQSLGASGYQRLPGGFMVQWGFRDTTGNPNAIVFPTAFPTACRAVVTGNEYVGSGGAGITVSGLTTTGFNLYSTDNSVDAYWFAIGY